MILKILDHNGYKKVLLSGIMKEGKQGTATLVDGKIALQMNESYPEYIHGAGDCLSSAFIGKLMSGMPFEKAAQAAVDFCKECILLQRVHPRLRERESGPAFRTAHRARHPHVGQVDDTP